MPHRHAQEIVHDADVPADRHAVAHHDVQGRLEAAALAHPAAEQLPDQRIALVGHRHRVVDAVTQLARCASSPISAHVSLVVDAQVDSRFFHGKIRFFPQK